MKQTILKLIAEAILIIFSVLLAFWIDSKTKQVGDKKLRKELIDRIYTDIKNDSVSYSLFLRNRKKAEASLETLIRYVSSDKITADSLASLLAIIEWIPGYQPTNSTYSSIINSGQLQLFEEDTLFMNISFYYNQNDNVIGFTQAYMAGSNRFLVPFLNEHFDRRLFDEKLKHNVKAIDINKFKSKEFFNVLISLKDRLIYEGFLTSHAERQTRILGEIRSTK